MTTRKLGIVVSHPIQYNTPLFRYLSTHIDLEVFYGYAPTPQQVGRVGFGVNVDWGVNLLAGHDHHFLKNLSQDPSSSHFRGINTPEIGLSLKKAEVTHVLIFGWFLKSYWQAFLHCLRYKVPVAVRGDSQLNPLEHHCKTRIRQHIYPLFLRRYTRILYVGQRNREYLLHNGAREERLLFAPHTVDPSLWKGEKIPSPKPDIITFVWIAKFIDKKRPQDAVQAFKQAATSDQALRLIMVGTGELADSCKLLATNNPNISFAGFKNQEELRGVYSAADCLVLTSDFRETWGLVVNEAFASGIPAIVSNACGCAPDLIQNDQTGFTYPLGHTAELSRLMLKVADTLRRDRTHFRPHIEVKNETYSFSTNLRAVLEFMNT